jgi:hypothetical protein
LGLKIWQLAVIGMNYERRQPRRPRLITTDHPTIIKPKSQGTRLGRRLTRQVQEVVDPIRSVWLIILFGWIVGRSVTWALRG